LNRKFVHEEHLTCYILSSDKRNRPNHKQKFPHKPSQLHICKTTSQCFFYANLLPSFTKFRCVTSKAPSNYNYLTPVLEFETNPMQDNTFRTWRHDNLFQRMGHDFIHFEGEVLTSFHRTTSRIIPWHDLVICLVVRDACRCRGIRIHRGCCRSICKRSSLI